MAHLVAPQPSNDDLPVFFTVDGAVGEAPAQNSREDVLFVQFAMQEIGKNELDSSSPLVTAAFKKVKVTGTIDSVTIDAIRTLQSAAKERGNENTIVDGRLSPVQGSSYNSGAALSTIVFLNNSLQQRNIDIWPRIDKIAGCPSDLVKMVTRTVAGT